MNEYRIARPSSRTGTFIGAGDALRRLAGTPDGRLWRHDGGNIGLATSGSGDVLSGLIAGFAARGATIEQASSWGVALHARAGNALAARVGVLGYLAREIAGEVPSIMQALAHKPRQS